MRDTTTRTTLPDPFADQIEMMVDGDRVEATQVMKHRWREE
jgi:hypothetical protein